MHYLGWHPLTGQARVKVYECRAMKVKTAVSSAVGVITFWTEPYNVNNGRIETDVT